MNLRYGLSLWILASMSLLLMGVPSDASGQDIGVERLWEIGGIDGPEEVAWNRIAHATVLDDAIYIVGHHPSSVRVFSQDGTFIRELGREGKGPGEFIGPSFVRQFQDSVGIYDFMQRRWAFFENDGRALSTIRYEKHPSTRYTSLEKPLWRVAGQHLALTTWVTDDNIHYPRALIRWSEDSVVDTLATIATGQFMSRPLGVARAQWNTVPVGVGSAGGVAMVGDSVLFVLDGMEPALSQYQLSSTGLSDPAVFPLSGSPVTLTPEIQDRLIEWFVTRWGIDRSDYEFRSPTRIPVWTAIFATTPSIVFLKRGGEGGPFGGREEWLRLNLATNERERLTLPNGVRVLHIGSQYILGLRRGQFDEPYLQLYEMLND